MFEAELSAKLKRIFDLKKVSFDLPGESREQECIFIDIENCNSSIKEGQALALVTGSCVIFANDDKLPYGYIAKRIQLADPSDTKDLFFFEIEANSGRFQNIVQRSFSFTYFFNSQYNPPTGTITSIELETT